LFEGPHEGSETALSPLDAMPQGTIVLWENMDRKADTAPGSEPAGGEAPDDDFGHLPPSGY